MSEESKRKEGESAHDLFSRMAKELYEQHGIIVERIEFGWTETVGGQANIVQTEIQSMKR